MAMAMHQRLCGNRLEGGSDLSGLLLPGDEFLEQQRMFRDQVRVRARNIALNSSRNVKRQDGSSPTTGMPRRA